MRKNLILPSLSLFLLSFLVKDDKPILYPIDSVNELTVIFASGNFVDENGEKLDFLLDTPDDVKAFLNELKLGNSEAHVYDDQNSIYIELIQNHKRINLWTYDAKRLTFNIEYQKCYRVDLEFFRKLHKKHPLKYRFERKSFASKEEFEKYHNLQIQEKTFLYSEVPMFQYEGSFQIQFPKSSKYPSPKIICEYLKPLILEIESDENKFSISYTLDDYNMSNLNQYTMTISGPKKIYENLKVDEFESKNWKLTDEVAGFYYKTK